MPVNVLFWTYLPHPRTGSNGAFSLVVILGAIVLFEKQKSLAAGIVLACIILKPPQGLPILLLTGLWLLARRDWRAILGVGLGGFGLLLLGMLKDPLWVLKFGEAGQAVMNRTLGIHSNVWAFAYRVCEGKSPCSSLLGAAGALILIVVSGLYLWKYHARLTAWQVFNIAIPVGFISTVYLWQYDQILYVIPVAWIVGTLVEKTKMYIHAFLFLLILVAYSIFALFKMSDGAGPLTDLWSIGNTLIVFSSLLLVYSMKEKAGISE